MSNVAKIDQNDKPTWLAYNDTTGLPETVYTDPVTGALLVYLVASDANLPTTVNRAAIDANDHATALAYNYTSGQTEALRCGIGGELLISIQ